MGHRLSGKDVPDKPAFAKCESHPSVTRHILAGQHAAKSEIV
jgi:hypothetical protein